MNCTKCAIPYIMHTLIVSDIHLGSSVSRARDLLRILGSESYERLVLNGDIFDDLNFTRLTHEHWQLLSKLRELSNPKYNIEVIWIAGNHDGAALVLSRLIGISVRSEFSFDWNGKRCLAIHGHQFDNFITRNPIISAIGSWIYLGIQKIDTERQFISRYLKRASKSWLRISEKVARGAVRYGKMKGAQIVFCGHTHKQMAQIVSGVEYYNSGCWTDIPSSYILLDDREIKIKEV